MIRSERNQRSVNTLSTYQPLYQERSSATANFCGAKHRPRWPLVGRTPTPTTWPLSSIPANAPKRAIRRPVAGVRGAARGGSGATAPFQRLRPSRCAQGADRARSGPPTGRVRLRRRSARLAKGDVTLPAGTVQSELVGIVEVRRIPIGRAPQQDQPRTRFEVHTTQRRVTYDVAVVPPKRRFVAQYLLKKCAEQFRLVAHLLLNIETSRQNPSRETD